MENRVVHFDYADKRYNKLRKAQSDLYKLNEITKNSSDKLNLPQAERLIAKL